MPLVASIFVSHQPRRIDVVLGPVQQAKYRLLEVEVERKLRALMTEMRGQNRGRRGTELPEN